MVWFLRWVVTPLLATPVVAETIDSITTSITKGGYVFVQVTAGPLIGWGQASYNNERSDLMGSIAEKVHSWVGPHAIGKEFRLPSDIDAFAEEAWRANYKRTGTVLAQALAGIDTALWDLVAKSQNVSVCSLVAQVTGGQCKTHVPVYGSNGNRGKHPKDIVGNAVANRDKYGVKAFKFQIESRMGHDVDIKPGRTEELIPLARKELGAEITLMVDANGGFDNYTHARSVAQLLVEHNYTWLEEPFPYWEYDEASALATELMPALGIALGENEYRLDVWERNIHSMKYAQPDVHYLGGLSRALRVVKMAMAANITVVPHSPNPSMVCVFGLSVMAAVPNAYHFMEFDAVNTRSPPDGTDFFNEPAFALTNGAIAVPTSAGWGVTLKPGLLNSAVNKTSRGGTTIAVDSVLV